MILNIIHSQNGEGEAQDTLNEKEGAPCGGGKLAYSESNASDADASLLAARENLHSRMQMSQMLMQNQFSHVKRGFASASDTN